MMEEFIGQFTEHLDDAMRIGRKAELTPQHSDIRNVVVAGLGGSGISGNIISELVSQKMKVPMLVCKDYILPQFVSEHTLLICCSHSGNTEETLHAFEHGIRREAKIICITSGGSLETLAKKAGMDVIKIPKNLPPRVTISYSMIQQLYVLFHYRLIDLGFEEGIKDSISFLNKKEKNIRKEALKVAKKIHKRTPVIYAPAGMEAIAIRFRQQLNENSKVLGWHNVIPEMTHNELVGWNEKGKYTVLFLRNETDYDRVQKRTEIIKGIISKYTNRVIEIWSKGDSLIERALYLIHLTDWVSYYLADLRKVDADQVKIIEEVKASLAE
jgi:glucose/mannose-6-phosphate isomerase